MSIMDHATSLSLEYLRAVENRLALFWDKQGEPVFLPEHITRQSLFALRYDLHDLLTGSPRDAALRSTQEFGENHVQTVGFGLAPDFDLFVKLGFLCGQRLVLWDMVGSRLLVHEEFTPDQVIGIGAAACNLLLLRPVIEQGGLVILPHPMTWSDFARKVADDLKERGNRSRATFGLSMALSTVDEGFILHPYTLLEEGERPVPSDAVDYQAGDLYSRGNYLSHRAISELLKDQRFAYLSRISATGFYKIVTQFNDLQSELAKHFCPSGDGLSAQQANLEIKRSVDKLAKLIEERNESLLKYVIEGGESSVGFVIAFLTAIATGKFDLSDSALSLAVGDLSTKLYIALRKWFSKPKKPVIVQAFVKIKETTSLEESLPRYKVYVI
jgi:hypothetical protein